MSKQVLDHLPDAVARGVHDWRGSQGQASLLMTVDDDGLIRTSLLSNAELYIRDSQHMRLALWANSNTSGNLARTGRGTLFRVDDGTAHSIQFECSPPAPLVELGDKSIVMVDATVAEVQSDTVEYATIMHALDFKLVAPESVLPQWERVQRALASS